MLAPWPGACRHPARVPRVHACSGHIRGHAHVSAPAPAEPQAMSPGVGGRSDALNCMATSTVKPECSVRASGRPGESTGPGPRGGLRPRPLPWYSK